MDFLSQQTGGRLGKTGQLEATIFSEWQPVAIFILAYKHDLVLLKGPYLLKKVLAVS